MSQAAKKPASSRARSKKATVSPTSERATPSLVPLDIGRRSDALPYVELIEPHRSRDDVVLSPENRATFGKLLEEFRKGDTLRRHGLAVKSRVLFCGPPGCGKSATAEAFAFETGLDFLVVRLDAVISSFLGETAANLKAVFEAAERRPCVLFFDEFDALARTRTDTSEHNELRRVVNSLLMMIERFQGRGYVIAATNLESTLDAALWRRFDEVIYFEQPSLTRIREMLKLKTQGVSADFDLMCKAEALKGYSYAEIERVVLNAIKSSIMDNRKRIGETDFDLALKEEIRRRKIQKKIAS